MSASATQGGYNEDKSGVRLHAAKYILSVSKVENKCNIQSEEIT